MKPFKNFLLDFIYIVASIVALVMAIAFLFAFLCLLGKLFIEWVPPYSWLVNGVQ